MPSASATGEHAASSTASRRLFTHEKRGPLRAGADPEKRLGPVGREAGAGAEGARPEPARRPRDQRGRPGTSPALTAGTSRGLAIEGAARAAGAAAAPSLA